MSNCWNCFSKRRQQSPVSGSTPDESKCLNCFSKRRQQPPESGSALTEQEQQTGSASTEEEEVINSLKEVSDPKDLREFVRLVKQLLEKKKLDNGSTSQSAKENTGMLASFVKSGARFSKFVTDHIQKIGEEGTSKVVAEVLGKIGEVHCVVGGLSIAAYLIEKFEDVSANKGAALELLTNMVDLATAVFKAKGVIPEEEEKLKDAAMLLVQGSIMCISQLTSSKISRFLKTSVNKENLREMSNKLRHHYDDLDLTIDIAIAKRQPRFLSPRQPSYPEDAVGIASAQEQVMKLLNMPPTRELLRSKLLNIETDLLEITLENDLRLVVIYGVGGMGKTTLATSVVSMLNLKGYNFACVNLDEEEKSLKKKQEQILLDAFPNFNSGNRIKLRDCKEGQDRLLEAFRCPENKPVLLFIDNALRSEDLRELLPKKLSDLPKRSRILLTTRTLDATDVIKSLTRHPFVMKPLDEGHAKEILCKDSEKRELIKNDMERILRICGGVPLALTIVSRHLEKMNYHTDNCRQILSALEEGGHIKEEKMSERIVNFVYSTLEDGTQDAFLDICCFYNGWIRRHVEYIVGAQEIMSLEEGALVTPIVNKKLYDNGNPFFSYSDDMGEERLIVHDIVRAKGRTMSKSTRFTDAESFTLAAAQDEKLRQMKGVWLHYDDNEEMSVEAKHVDLTSGSLRALSLGEGIRLDGQCERAFKELRFLDISYDDMLPIQLSKLTRLASLVLHFQTTRNTIWETQFKIELPDSLRLLKVDSSYCSQLQSLTESFGKLSSLQELNMSSCSKLQSLPESFGKLSSLQKLDMSLCYQLQSIPESFGKLSSLRKLSMPRCYQLQSLPESFGKLSSLQELDISNCSRLQSLPESFGKLSSLQELDISKCSELQSLPESFGKLSSLRKLRMSRCFQLQLESLP